MPRDTQCIGSFRYGKSQRFETVMPHRQSGWGGLFIRIGYLQSYPGYDAPVAGTRQTGQTLVASLHVNRLPL